MKWTRTAHSLQPREDFDNALKLFETVAVQQITKLNDKERQIAAVIKDRSPCDINDIRDATGFGFSSIYELIHGDRKDGSKGLLEKIRELRLYPKNEFNEETGARWGRNHYSLPENWKIVDSSESIVYWEDNEEDQLRSVSGYFGDDFRNSENGGEGLDSRLGGVNSDIIQNTNTNFGTSEEYETSTPHHPGDYPYAPQRSSEIESTASPTEAFERVKSEKDTRNAALSISETQSEVKRSDPEASWSMTYVQVHVLKDIPDFIGLDEQTFALRENDVIFLPVENALVLAARKLARITW